MSLAVVAAVIAASGGLLAVARRRVMPGRKGALDGTRRAERAGLLWRLRAMTVVTEVLLEAEGPIDLRGDVDLTPRAGAPAQPAVEEPVADPSPAGPGVDENGGT